jgi:iron complex outermembrane receptor protein
MQEVTVTSQRRRERLEDVPLSVVAKSGAELQEAGITDTNSIQQVTPGLKMVSSGAYLQPALRGVSSASTAPSTDPNVAIYLDGVYQPNQTINAFNLPDVDRIEVAKGPQGTLFGRNATGGAIQIFTRNPAFTPAANVSVGYGEFNDAVVQGFVTAPLVADKVAFSLSAYHEAREGYHYDLLNGGDNTTDFRSDIVRGKLLLHLTERFSLLLSGMYTRRYDPDALSGIALNGNSAGAASPIIASRPYDLSVNFYPIVKIHDAAASAVATLTTDFGTFTSTSAYSNSSSHLGFDGDYTPLQIAYFDLVQPDENIVQELNFATPTSFPVHLVSGFFYYRDRTGYDPIDAVLTDNLVSAGHSHANTKALAGYVDVEYDVTSRLTAIAGVRRSWEEKTLAGASSFGVNAVPGPIVPVASKSWNSLTPRASLRFALTDSTNIYASYNRGFKSGAFDVSALSPNAVNPEKIDAYEIGLKSRQSPFQFTTAAFYYKYTDEQVQSQQGIFSVLQNAASSKIYGIDADGSFQVGRDLKLAAGLSWLHARYDQFTQASVLVPTGKGGNANVFYDASGQQMIRSPNWTVNLQADYKHSFALGEAGLSATAYYSDRFSFEPSYRIYQAGYVSLNARASFAPSAAEGLRFVVWGKNLSDRRIIQSTFIANFGDGVYYALPRTYGGSVEYSF